DKVLQRQHITKPANWVGIKAHYHHPDFPNEKVGLHNFEGGYCGLSRTESGAVNVCYLANYQSFKKAKNVTQFQSTLTKNPKLKMFFAKAEPLFNQPKTIAQISFAQREPYFDGMLMTGDAAGLIHPLCGNGMAMAIHSGKIAAELIAAQVHRSDHYDLEALGAMYQKKWNQTFKTRINAGRLLQRILLSPMLSDISMKTVVKSPWIVKRLITMTHGEPVS
ncbi:MAG: FAD-dependent oxidoreductase, partial [Bacteroidota bacterium]